MTAENILKQRYTREIAPDPNGGFSTRIVEFPGCFAEGETVNEALENLDRAAVSWVEATLKQGLPVPPPRGIGAK